MADELTTSENMDEAPAEKSELDKQREASGIVFVSHADVVEDNKRTPDGHPSNLLVGREGEKKELRADLFTDSGPRKEMQVEAHVTPVEGAVEETEHSPGKFSGVNAREGVVVDLDEPVVGHVDDEGNVTADNEPAETGEFVQDPDAVTESAENNEGGAPDA